MRDEDFFRGRRRQPAGSSRGIADTSVMPDWDKIGDEIVAWALVGSDVTDKPVEVRRLRLARRGCKRRGIGMGARVLQYCLGHRGLLLELCVRGLGAAAASSLVCGVCGSCGDPCRA